MPLKKWTKRGLHHIFNQGKINLVWKRLKGAKKQLTEWNKDIQEVLTVKAENPGKPDHLLPIAQSKLDSFNQLRSDDSGGKIGQFYFENCVSGKRNATNDYDLNEIYTRAHKKGYLVWGRC